MRRFGLIGYPLTHSFSAKYFEDKFRREQIKDCCYSLFPLASIDLLPALLRDVPELKGLNVTIPYKQQVLDLLDENHLPAGLKACNCIRIENGKLSGHNTDVTGFEKSIQPLLKPHHRKALVLGTGGAASAVIYVLNNLGISVSMVSRNPEGHSAFSYGQLNRDLMLDHTVIINTTPLGTYPDIGSLPPIPYEFTGNKHLFFDLVYNPSQTSFLKQGELQGAQTKNGYEMLVIQAEESWKIWNHEPTPTNN